MNARTINISSLVILLSLISLICEGFIYYFLPQHIWAILFSVICSLLLSHFFLEMAFSYTYNILHTGFMTFSTMLFSIIVYLIQPNPWISYDFSLVFLVLSNWLTPFIYCTIRDLTDPGPRFNGYDRFFRQTSVILLLVYLFSIIKQFYITPIVPPYKALAFGAQNFIPYMSTGTYLEEMIRTNQSLVPLFCFLAEMIILFIPFGFYVCAYGRKKPFILRLLCYLAFPLLLELSQELTGLGRGHIDDYISALLGTLIGVMIYHAANGIFHIVAGRTIAAERTTLNIHHFEI